ncbi:MAG TPA: hypothetical protein VJT84_10225 [Gaiellaceae bacterium]|nr:hypothetical protein [Gaiellaceae bacterium]
MSQVEQADQAAGESMVEQGKQIVQQQAGAARDAAGQAVGQRVETGARQLGEHLHAITQGLNRTSHGLRAEGKDQPASMLEKVGSRTEEVAAYLSAADGRRLLNDFEHFGRRNPWLAIAGGVAVGLLTSRFLKASSARRFEDLRSQGYHSRRTPWGDYPVGYGVVQPQQQAQPPSAIAGTG